MPTYDPTQPFPAPLTPGEFGRAWVDSLQAHEPEQFQQLMAAGTLEAEAARVEADAQEQMGELLTQQERGTMPAGLTPLGWQTLRALPSSRPSRTSGHRIKCRRWWSGC